MSALLIIDTETSGLDPEADHLVEVGAVLFDTVLGIPIESRAFLVGAVSNAAEPINRIPAAAIALDWASDPGDVRDVLLDLMRQGASVRGETICVAHNAAFDRQWIGGLVSRWICTQTDVDWARVPGGSGSLVSVALAYDVGVVRAHRAIEDCLTLAAILGRVHELEDGLDGWLDRQLAKDARFGWDGARKLWIKNVRESQVAGFCAAQPFKTRVTP